MNDPAVQTTLPAPALAPTPVEEAYLNKEVTPPSYIWDGTFVDLELVASTVLGSDQDRVKALQSEPTVPPLITPEPDASRSHLVPSLPPVEAVPIPAPDLEKPVAVKPLPAVRSAVMPLLSDTMNAAEPVNFHTQFHVGTLPKPFYLDIDSGSSLLWLQSRLSTSDARVPDQSMYTPSTSSTSSRWPPHVSPSSTSDGDSSATADFDEVTVVYGDVSTTTVALYTDTVSVGGLNAVAQVLGAATVAKLDASFQHSKANGVIGLGFGLPGSAVPPHTNLVRTLSAEGALKHASFAIVGPRVDPKAAKQIDEKGVKQPRGSFVIGSLDPSFYTGTIAWCPRAQDSQRWVVRMDEVRISGPNFPVNSFKNQLALIDTGTALIRVSPETFRDVYRKIPGVKLYPYTPSGKTQTMFTYPQREISGVEFVFQGRTFSLTQSDLTLGQVKSGAETEMASSICRMADGMWKPLPRNLWILGGIFLDNLVTIFNFDEEKIGFADLAADEGPAGRLDGSSKGVDG